MQPLRGKGGNSFQTIPLAGEPATKNYGHWTLEEVGRVKKLKPNEKAVYNDRGGRGFPYKDVVPQIPGQ